MYDRDKNYGIRLSVCEERRVVRREKEREKQSRRAEMHRDAISKPEHYWKIIRLQIAGVYEWIYINSIVVFYIRGIRSRWENFRHRENTDVD